MASEDGSDPSGLDFGIHVDDEPVTPLTSEISAKQPAFSPEVLAEKKRLEGQIKVFHKLFELVSYLRSA